MSKEVSIPQEIILSKIYEIRGVKVMLSHHLAELYQVETRRLNEQVRRNPGKFPGRYMFQLTTEEYKSLRSQNATLKRGQHSKYPPYAFTEHGILMLSSVLRSERADKVNMLIIDTFVKLNEMLLTHKDILLKLEEMEKRVAGQDEKVLMIFNYLKQFIKEQETPRKQIGFKQKGEK
jgi:phage regulator Rha-like protein